MKKLLFFMMVTLVAISANCQTNTKKVSLLKQLKTTYNSIKNVGKTDLKKDLSIKQLETIYRDLNNGNTNALKDFGFTLVDKKSQIDVTDYDGNIVETKIVKEVYSYNGSDGLLAAVYINNPSDEVASSDGELKIVCTSETWNQLKREYKGSNEEGVYISLDYEGIIRFSNECSPSWLWQKAPFSLAELMNIYNKRQDRDFINQQLAISGLDISDNKWTSGFVTFEINANGVIVEANDPEGNYNFPDVFGKWKAEAEKMGYQSDDIMVGIRASDSYRKEGSPNIDYSETGACCTFSISKNE